MTKFGLVMAGVIFIIGAGCLGATHAWVSAAPGVRYGCVAGLALASLIIGGLIGAKPRQNQQQRRPGARQAPTRRPW